MSHYLLLLSPLFSFCFLSFFIPFVSFHLLSIHLISFPFAPFKDNYIIFLLFWFLSSLFKSVWGLWQPCSWVIMIIITTVTLKSLWEIVFSFQQRSESAVYRSNFLRDHFSVCQLPTFSPPSLFPAVRERSILLSQMRISFLPRLPFKFHFAFSSSQFSHFVSYTGLQQN